MIWSFFLLESGGGGVNQLVFIVAGFLGGGGSETVADKGGFGGGGSGGISHDLFGVGHPDGYLSCGRFPAAGATTVTKNSVPRPGKLPLW